VIPLELTGLVQQLGATLTGNGAAKSRSSGDGNASGD
jgi:hypothetical protein